MINRYNHSHRRNLPLSLGIMIAVLFPILLLTLSFYIEGIVTGGIPYSFAQTGNTSTANKNITGSTTTNATATILSSRANPVPASSVHITKDSTIDYSIANGTVLIGAFNNSYTMTGDSKSLRSSKDLIISTVQDDFIKSPSAGYVLVGNNSSSTSTATGQTIANPFASIDTIKQNIQSKITESIRSLSNTSNNIKPAAIHCDFDSSLREWDCDVHPLYK